MDLKGTTDQSRESSSRERALIYGFIKEVMETSHGVDVSQRCQFLKNLELLMALSMDT